MPSRGFYLVLPYFKKEPKECEKDFEKWLYVLKHMEALERIPFMSQKEVFKKLADFADSRSLTSKEHAMYQESLFKALDTESCLLGAKQEGLAEGRAEGLIKGRAEGLTMGRAEGLTKGRAEGETTKAREIAINLKNAGMDITFIVNTTGLAEEEIRNLQ